MPKAQYGADNANSKAARKERAKKRKALQPKKKTEKTKIYSRTKSQMNKLDLIPAEFKDKSSPVGALQTWELLFLLDYTTHWDMAAAWKENKPAQLKETRFQMLHYFDRRHMKKAFQWLTDNFTADKVLNKIEAQQILTSIARTNPAKYMQPDGSIDIKAISDDKPAGITKLKTTNNKYGSNTELQMTSQIDAIDKLSKLQGWEAPKKVDVNNEFSLSSDFLDLLDEGKSSLGPVIDAELIEESEDPGCTSSGDPELARGAGGDPGTLSQAASGGGGKSLQHPVTQTPPASSNSKISKNKISEKTDFTMDDLL